jgi:hypothetical protein
VIRAVLKVKADDVRQVAGAFLRESLASVALVAPELTPPAEKRVLSLLKGLG